MISLLGKRVFICLIFTLLSTMLISNSGLRVNLAELNYSIIPPTGFHGKGSGSFRYWENSMNTAIGISTSATKNYDGSLKQLVDSWMDNHNAYKTDVKNSTDGKGNYKTLELMIAIMDKHRNKMFADNNTLIGRKNMSTTSGIVVDQVAFRVVNDIDGAVYRHIYYTFSVGNNKYATILATVLHNKIGDEQQKIIEESITSIQLLK